MKKVLIATAIFVGIQGGLKAQHVHTSRCGAPNFAESMQSVEFATQEAQFRAYLANKESLPFAEKALDLRIIPVVVHVIHDGTPASNISKAEINTMMTNINNGFNLSYPNVGNIPVHFDSLATDAEIEFRLAEVDPWGNCTDGIRRVYAPYAAINAHEDKRFKSLSYWDRSKYLNIWIVKNIKEPNSTTPGTVLGYAYYPGGAQALKDGPTVASSVAGTSQSVAAHEVGHYLNLVHMWGDEDCGDDQVNDTPISKEPNFAWPNPCDSIVKEATCYMDFATNQHDSIMRFRIGENYQNIMDYVNNYNCPNMFTKGQVERMRSALEFYSFRNNLWQPENLTASGVADGSPACTDLKPIADFWSNKVITCEGGTINFSDGSFNGNISAATHTFNWEFEGGTPATSTDKNPTVTYNTAGTYKVKFTVSNSAGSSTKERVEFIKVMSTDIEDKSFGYREGFEFGEPFLQNKWALSNEPSADKGWVWTDQASYSGDYSLVCRNVASIRDAKYTAITPAYNMNSITGSSKKLRFKAAYALRTESDYAFDPEDQNYYAVINDKLIISRSADCGLTWSPVKSFTMAELVSGGVNPGNFVPQDLVEWKTHTINLNGTNAGGANVRFRFEFTSGCQFNNNLYIDDIEIYEESKLSVDNFQTEDLQIAVFPNPVNADATLKFALPNQIETVQISAYDMVGKQVGSIYNGSLGQGEHMIQISRSLFGAPGVYFIKVQLDQRSFVERIVVQ